MCCSGWVRQWGRGSFYLPIRVAKTECPSFSKGGSRTWTLFREIIGTSSNRIGQSPLLAFSLLRWTSASLLPGTLTPHPAQLWGLCMLVTQLYPTLCDPMGCGPPGSSVHGIFQARILEWLAIPLQGIFLIQGSNLGFLHCRWILYCLSHQGSLGV